MSALFHLPKAVRIKSSGVPYAGAKARFYQTGTTTPIDVHIDAARTIPFAQPLQADAAGQFQPIYLNALENYKMVLTDSADVQIDSIDPAYSALFTAEQLSGVIYPQTPAELTAGVTPTSTLYLEGDIRRYGASTAATNNSGAINTALSVSAAGGSAVYIPSGTWTVTSSPTFTAAASMMGAGATSSFISANGCDGITLSFSTYFGRTTIRDIGITGVGASAHSGINAPGTSDHSDQLYGLTIERCQIRNFNVGISARTIWQATIINNRIEDVDRGIDLIGQNIGVNITLNNIVHTNGGGGAGSVVGIRLDAYTYATGGSLPPEGVQIDKNFVYGFSSSITNQLSNFTNITYNNLSAGVTCIDSTTVNIGFNVDGNYFECLGSSFVAGVYLKALGAGPTSHTRISGNHFFATGTTTATGCKVNDSSNGGQQYVEISGNSFEGFTSYDILVDHATETSIVGNTCLSSAPTNSISVPAVAAGKVHIDRNTCTKAISFDVADAAAGKIIAGVNIASASTLLIGSQQVPTVASATALTLPLGSSQHEHFIISGTVDITSVVATGWIGRTVTLHFQGALTFTDGSNLALAGNLVTTANDTITLGCVGTTWEEVSRSVN